MALSGLVSLAGPFLNPTAAQLRLFRATTPNDASIENDATAATGDKFTPSTQKTGEALGPFAVNQLPRFSPTAENLLAPGVASAPASKVLSANAAHVATAADGKRRASMLQRT